MSEDIHLRGSITFYMEQNCFKIWKHLWLDENMCFTDEETAPQREVTHTRPFRGGARTRSQTWTLLGRYILLIVSWRLTFRNLTLSITTRSFWFSLEQPRNIYYVLDIVMAFKMTQRSEIWSLAIVTRLWVERLLWSTFRKVFMCTCQGIHRCSPRQVLGLQVKNLWPIPVQVPISRLHSTSYYLIYGSVG